MLSVPRRVAELAFRIDLCVDKLREILAVKVFVVQNNSDENTSSRRHGLDRPLRLQLRQTPRRAMLASHLEGRGVGFASAR